mgnify:CR=1 FL=1
MTAGKVKKAVFPVAGLGTRFLPATKAVPKELLPVVDRPLIQYAVDEAIEAGIGLYLARLTDGMRGTLECAQVEVQLLSLGAHRNPPSQGRIVRRDSRDVLDRGQARRSSELARVSSACRLTSSTSRRSIAMWPSSVMRRSTRLTVSGASDR